MRIAEYLDAFESRNEKSTMKLDKRAIPRYAHCASVAELVDAADSKSAVPWDLPVRFGSEAPNILDGFQESTSYNGVLQV